MRHSLFAVLIGLIVSSAALAQTETPAPPAPACALRQPAVPRHMGLGTIIGFQTPAAARADLPRREARLGGAIDPRYLDDPRAVVRRDTGRVEAFDVPEGMTVQVGDRVKLHDSYRSKASPCSYVPILITADDIPVS